MKIGISGSRGFVGQSLSISLKNELKAQVLHIPRSLLYSDPSSLSDFIEGCDVIIHLSGAPIISRWTKKRKQIIYDSRVRTTKNLTEAFRVMKVKPNLFISTSAIGIYKKDGVHDESSKEYSNDFVGQLCREWEDAAFSAEEMGIRTVIFRLGVILGREGGLLKKVIPIFRLGLGGNLGNGKQAFSFIHIHDLLQAYKYVIQNSHIAGVFNLVAPESCTNKEFTKALSSCFKKPAFFHIPAILLKVFMGEGANILLKGESVSPKRLVSSGFVFKYPDLQAALSSLLRDNC